MWFLLTALLLAAAVWYQPWTHVELPGEDARAQEITAAFDIAPDARADVRDLRALKSAAAGAVALQKAEALRATQASAQAPAPEVLAVNEAPVPHAIPYSGELEDLICSYSWPCSEALAIAFCESTMHPDATNGTSYGLFQINEIHAGRFPDFWTMWMDPVTNTRWAYEIWSASGWHPWSCLPY